MKINMKHKRKNTLRFTRQGRAHGVFRGSLILFALCAVLALSLAACGGGSGSGSDGDSGGGPNTGQEQGTGGAVSDGATSGGAVSGGATSGGAVSGGATSGGAAGETAEGAAVRIGTKDFTENLLLGEIYALALEDKGGLSVERMFGLASSAVHQTLISDEVDLYPEYTGTGLLAVLQLPLETDAQKVYDTVKEEYKKQFDVVWLDYAQANDGQGIVVTKEASDKFGIKNISDLQKNAKDIRFISQGEFDEREDGIPALEKAYGPFDWKSSMIIDNSLKYTTMESGEGDAAPAYTTEGKLIDEKFVLLEDDKKVWPPYNIAPVVQAKILETYPQIADVLNAVNAKIDTDTITQLNAEVDIDGKEYAEVAKAFYDSIKSEL